MRRSDHDLLLKTVLEQQNTDSFKVFFQHMRVMVLDSVFLWIAKSPRTAITSPLPTRLIWSDGPQGPSPSTLRMPPDLASLIRSQFPLLHKLQHGRYSLSRADAARHKQRDLKVDVPFRIGLEILHVGGAHVYVLLAIH